MGEGGLALPLAAQHTLAQMREREGQGDCCVLACDTLPVVPALQDTMAKSWGREGQGDCCVRVVFTDTGVQVSSRPTPVADMAAGLCRTPPHIYLDPAQLTFLST